MSAVEHKESGHFVDSEKKLRHRMEQAGACSRHFPAQREPFLTQNTPCIAPAPLHTP